MIKRMKPSAPATREEMEQLVAEIFHKQLARDTLAVNLDRKVAEVREAHEPKIHALEDELAALLARAELWADAQRPGLGDRKSIDLVHATVGWRTGQPEFRVRSKWTLEKILAAIRERPVLAKRYIRIVEEVNKQAIIGDRAELDKDELASVGVKIRQEERFYVEPKAERPVETLTKEAA